MRELEREGFEVTYLDVAPDGLLDLGRFEASLRKDTSVVSVMFVNNEIGVIQEFLPRQLSDAETAAAIDGAIAALGATGIRDMGRVMAELRDRHAGQMDFGAVGPMVKARLLN